MIRYISIALGGAIGTLLRFFVTNSVISYFRTPAFPWGTLSVNLIGSFVIGILAGLNDNAAFTTGLRLFLFVGILGGFTTFSSFSLETMQLFRQGQATLGISYILASNIGGLLLALTGYYFVQLLLN